MIKVLFIRIPVDADREEMFAGLKSCVSGECYAEALGYRSKEVALRRLSGEALVRFALKECWNLSPETYRIARGEKGKPFIVGVENVFFNISHSGDYVVCAVSDREVGIDIEKRTRAVWRLPDVFSRAGSGSLEIFGRGGAGSAYFLTIGR